MNASDSHNDSIEPVLTRSGYTSMMVEMYLGKLGDLRRKKLLDLGPVCEENIMFFAKRVKKLYVCDLFLRFDRNRRRGLPDSCLWKHLDYAPQHFDGIHVWDFIEHLDDQQADQLVKICHQLLKPRGNLLVTAFEEQAAPPCISSFVIGEGYQITLRPQGHLELPWHCRSNRKLTALVGSFPKVKSFLYRNGVRELLFQCD